MSSATSLRELPDVSAEFIKAMQQGNAYEAMELINQGEELDAVYDNGDTALHSVIKKLQDPQESANPNFIDLAKLLIFKKADLLKKQNQKRETPLDLILKKSAPPYKLISNQITGLASNTDLTEEKLHNIRRAIDSNEPTNTELLAKTVRSVVPDISEQDFTLITNAAKREPNATKGETKVITYVWRNVIDERENITPSLSTQLKDAIGISEKHEKFKEELRLAKQQNALKQPSEPKQPSKWIDIDIWGKHIFYVNDPNNDESSQIEKRVSQIKTRLEQIYNQEETLRLVMDVATLAMKGHHDRSFSKQKELNIYIINPQDLGQRKSNLASGGGVYPFENGIFIADDLLKETDKIVGVILHEITHFVANEVFKNKALPYFSHQKEESQKHQEMKEQVEKKITERNKAAKFSDKDDETAHKIISNVFEVYNGPAQEPELIVCVSEIIGTLGPEKGASWVQKNYPELYTYFQKIFLPDVKTYLQSKAKVTL